MVEKILKFCRTHKWRIVFIALALAIILVNILSYYHSYPFNSDGVELQNNLSSWQQGAHQQSILVDNNYLLRVPFYWLLEKLNLAPRHALVVTFTAFMFAAYFSFYYGAQALNKRFGWFRERYLALGFLFLISLFKIYEYTINANVRNFELGAVFILLLPLVAISRTKLSLIKQALIVLATSLFLFDDPYFLYIVYLPLLLLLILSTTVAKKRAVYLRAMSIIVISEIFAKMWKYIIAKLGIVFTPLSLKHLHKAELIANTKGTLIALFLLGGGQYYDAKYQLLPAAFYLNAVVIAAIMLFSAVYMLANFKKLVTEPWKLFVMAIPWIVCAAYGYQPNAQMTFYRYMVFAAFGFPIIIAFMTSRLRYGLQYAVIALVILATLFNVQHSSSIAFASSSNPNIINQQIVTQVKKLGLKKGYADYWDANINTYFASEKVHFLPVVCDPGHHLQPMYWLVDNGEYKRVQTAKSFYLFDAAGSYVNGCDIFQVTQQFGPPSQVLDITPQFEIAIYNYDIYTNMDLNVPNGPN